MTPAAPRDAREDCPVCGGDGVCYVLAAHVAAPTAKSGPLSGFVELPCSVCGGSGALSGERAAWMRDGKRLRAFREERDFSLREAARWLGISPVDWSDAEHGKVCPNVYVSMIHNRVIAERHASGDISDAY